MTYSDRSGSTLVQVWAWCDQAPSHLPEPVMTYCQLKPLEQSPVKYFIQENVFENVICKMDAVTFLQVSGAPLLTWINFNPTKDK